METASGLKDRMLELISQIYPRQSETSSIIWSSYTNHICYNRPASGSYGKSFMYCAFPIEKSSEVEIEMLELTYINVSEVESWISKLVSLISSDCMVEFAYFMAKIGESHIISHRALNCTFRIDGLKSENSLHEILILASKPIARTELCCVLFENNHGADRIVIVEYVSLSFERTRAEAAYRYLKWTVSEGFIKVQSLPYEIEEDPPFDHEVDMMATLEITARQPKTMKYSEHAYNEHKEDRKKDVMREFNFSRSVDSRVFSEENVERPMQSRLGKLAVIDDKLKNIMKNRPGGKV